MNAPTCHNCGTVLPVRFPPLRADRGEVARPYTLRPDCTRCGVTNYVATVHGRASGFTVGYGPHTAPPDHPDVVAWLAELATWRASGGSR